MRLLQSLSRGLATLDYMRTADAPVRLTDVANFLGVEKPSASHLLKTLVASGYVQQDTSRQYFLTEKLVPQSKSPALDEIISTKESYHSVLAELVDATGECAHLAVLVGDRVWYIDKIESKLPLKVDHPIGSLAPLHCTALGKCFLAFGLAKIPEELQLYTPYTITQLDKLKKELALTNARGFAVDREEFSLGVRCIARPIYNLDGQVIAAVGVSGPSARIAEADLQTLGEACGRVLARHLDKEPLSE